MQRHNTLMPTVYTIAAVGVLLALFKLATGILSPVLGAFFVAALGRPVFRWLERRGLKSGWALLGVALLLIAFVGLLFVLGWLYVARLSSSMQVATELLQERFVAIDDRMGWNTDENPNSTEGFLAAGASAILRAIVFAVAGALPQVAVSFVLAIMMLLEWRRFATIIASVGGSQPFLSKLPVVAHTAVAYIAVRAKLNLITAVVLSVALWLLGVDYFLLWGVVIFFLSFVPYIGIFIAAAAPALMALAEAGWTGFTWVVVVITVLNLGIEYILGPMLTGKQLSISPTVVFFSFFFWAWILGPVGMVISMPITVLLMLVFAGDPATAFIAQLMANGGATLPAASSAAPAAPAISAAE